MNFQWIKCKIITVHTMRTCGGNGDVAPSIINLGTRWKWMVSLKLQPLYSWEKRFCPLNRRLRGPQLVIQLLLII